MPEFLRPSKRSLKNAQHYALIEAFLTAVTDAGFSAPKITMQVNSLRNAFAVEDRWFMIARASEIIARREAAHRRRVHLYSRLYAVVRAWAGSGFEQKDAPAARLQKLFALYKLKTGAQIDAVSGHLDNLISDLATEEMQADLQALDIIPLYEQMAQAHEETKSYRAEQGIEQSRKVTGALRAARQASDSAYDRLTYLIEAFSLAADDTSPYEAFIKRWNGLLKIYQDLLLRKSGSANPSGKSSAPSADSEDGGDGGSRELADYSDGSYAGS